MKHLYGASIDIKESGRWLDSWTTFNVVANGDAAKAIRKVQREYKRQHPTCQGVRVTSIRQIAEVHAS